MCERVRRSTALHTDDITVPLLAPRHTAYAWVYVGDAVNPYSVFDLAGGRYRDAPVVLLEGFAWFVQTDTYAGYNAVYDGETAHVGCWAHAQRYFFDARLSDSERAHDALAGVCALSESNGKRSTIRWSAPTLSGTNVREFGDGGDRLPLVELKLRS